MNDDIHRLTTEGFMTVEECRAALAMPEMMSTPGGQMIASASLLTRLARWLCRPSSWESLAHCSPWIFRR